jgi:AraC-like DNA-binding protein
MATDPYSHPILRWSTADVPAAQRFHYFAEALASSMMPMNVSCDRPADFESTLETAILGPLAITRIEGAAHRAGRGSPEMSRSDGDSFHLVMPQTASCLLDHRGAMRLQAGDVAFVDSRLGHEFALGPSHRNIHLSLPSAWVRQWLPTPEALVGRALPRDSGWVRALVAFAVGLTPEFVTRSPLPTTALVDQAGSLLALVAAEHGQPVASSTRTERGLAGRIRGCIIERSAEPGLSAEAIAGTVGVSKRTLHRVLAAEGQTFGALLITTRAETAAQMLRSRRHDRLTMAEIGYRAGFIDPSHFARVLRRYAGATPAQIRASSI